MSQHTGLYTSREERFYLNENFLSHLATLTFAGILVCIVIAQWDTVQNRAFLIASFLLLGSQFLLGISTKQDRYHWKVYPYLAGQTFPIILMVVHYPVYSVLFYPLSIQAMMRLRLHASLPWISVFCACTLLIVYRSVCGFGPAGAVSRAFTFNAVARSADFFLVGAFGYTLTRIQQDRQEIERLLAEAVSAHAHLHNDAAEQIRFLEMAEERKRLASDLHDTLSHTLTISIVQLEAAARLMGEESQQANWRIRTVHDQLTTGGRHSHKLCLCADRKTERHESHPRRLSDSVMPTPLLPLPPVMLAEPCRENGIAYAKSAAALQSLKVRSRVGRVAG